MTHYHPLQLSEQTLIASQHLPIFSPPLPIVASQSQFYGFDSESSIPQLSQNQLIYSQQQHIPSQQPIPIHANFQCSRAEAQFSLISDSKVFYI
jgi:hypothetical protein